MMKRIIILIILVIVWFPELVQDITGPGLRRPECAGKDLLLRKLQSRTTTKDNPTLYQTPEITMLQNLVSRSSRVPIR